MINQKFLVALFNEESVNIMVVLLTGEEQSNTFMNKLRYLLQKLDLHDNLELTFKNMSRLKLTVQDYVEIKTLLFSDEITNKFFNTIFKSCARNVITINIFYDLIYGFHVKKDDIVFAINVIMGTEQFEYTLDAELLIYLAMLRVNIIVRKKHCGPLIDEL